MTVLKLYNTATRKVQALKPITPGKISLYTCGPTVYDFAHIGNFRTFCSQDLLKRYLTHKGYQVKHVMNLTDVDDKTIKRSIQEKKPLKEVTTLYTNEFLKDMDALHCIRPNILCNATDVIPEIISMIEQLIQKKHAYVGEDHSVYFSVKSFKKYGKLAHLDQKNLKAGARVSHDEYDKESASDFALWKSHSTEDGDVKWESPWGPGRPGWHIECSAISTKFLGPTFDLHTGGIDLLFPHHQNELAQSECCFGVPFVKHWFHGAHILVDGKKMSKSLGNFFTLRDLKLNDARALRLFYLLSHYRSETNFTLNGLKEAEKQIQRIDEFIQRLQNVKSKAKKPFRSKLLLGRWNKELEKKLDLDLNTPEAIKHFFEITRQVNRFIEEEALDETAANDILSFFKQWNNVFPIFNFQTKKIMIPEEVQLLIEEREKARITKDFTQADLIRKKIDEAGFIILDTKEGPVVREKH